MKRTNAADESGRSSAAGLDGALQTAIRRPADFLDSNQGKRLGNAQRRDRHPATAEAKEYPVTIQARAGAYEASTSLKSRSRAHRISRWIVGRYAQTSVTAGTKTPIDFVVAMPATAPVRNLNFVTKKPSEKWTVEFKPDKIDALGPAK